MRDRKTIYINESFIKEKMDRSIKISRRLPEEFYNMSGKGVFPFSPNPAFPDITEGNFSIHILEKAYEDAKGDILKLGALDTDDEDIATALSRIQSKIKKIESRFKNQIEKICSNRIIDLFAPPEDTIDITLSLEPKLDCSTSVLQLDPEESPLEYDQMADARKFKKEVLKRRIINMLIAGASLYYSRDYKAVMEDIYEMDPELLSLYKKADILNTYLLLENPKLNITEGDKKTSGYVEVTLGDETSRSRIEARGETMQVLLYESVKGLMELFASHGLPKDRSFAAAVLKRTDYVKAEVWNMRMGTKLWEYFMDAAGNPESERIPYIFMEVCKLSPSRFNALMNEVFSRSRKASRMLDSIGDNVEYEDFLDRMKKANTDKNIIEDEYIHPEEL